MVLLLRLLHRGRNSYGAVSPAAVALDQFQPMSDPVKRWTELSCWGCSGHGQRSAYTIDGGDFMGADECGTCNGSGRLFRTDAGAVAQWPGGPFVGRLTRKELAINDAPTGV
jgi:hypothetical protein